MTNPSLPATSSHPESLAQNLESRRDALLEAFSNSIQLFLVTAEQFPRTRVKVRPSYEPQEVREGEFEKRPFTATEIVYHMIDVELLWQSRIHGMLDGTSRYFQQMNPDKEAQEKKYNTRDYERGLRELALSRSETTRLISGMSDAELALTGVHSRFGEMDTIKILETMEAHDRQHAAQLERTLAAIRE
jgi:hypothetical protein